MEDFMKRVRKEFDKGVSAVSAKSKEIIETSKLRGQISDLNEEKQEALETIGQMIYRMYREPDFDADQTIKATCRHITELEDEIQAIERDLEQIRVATSEAMGKTVCPVCKSAQDENDLFCRKCGTRLKME